MKKPNFSETKIKAHFLIIHILRIFLVHLDVLRHIIRCHISLNLIIKNKKNISYKGLNPMRTTYRRWREHPYDGENIPPKGSSEVGYWPMFFFQEVEIIIS